MERYDSYKDSGVEWMKDVPSDWELLRSRFLFIQRSSKNHPEEPLLSVTQERSLVRRDELETNVWNPDSDVSGYKLVKDGDFVISLRSFEGGLELSEVQGIVSPAYTVIYPIRRISSRYFKYLFKCHEFIIELNKYVSGIRQGKNISYSDFSEISLPIPSLTCQDEIGQFLDRKTTLIDSLIEKTVRKIELLKEKRTSLINEVVTKGLNPDVEMKDSGVEWIGEIPSHWEISKIKFECEIFGRIGFRGYTTEDIVDEGEGVITISPSNIFNDEFNLKNRTFLSWEKYHESPEIQIFHGDIILVKTGSTIGKTAIIPEGVPEMTINPQLVVLKRIRPLNRYLFAQTTCRFIKESFDIEQTGSTTPTISQEKIKEFPLLLPPLHEQEQIVEYLDNQTSVIDSTITTEEKRIELLKEYRQSLVSEVVTGKVKVTRDE